MELGGLLGSLLLVLGLIPTHERMSGLLKSRIPAISHDSPGDNLSLGISARQQNGPAGCGSASASR